MIFARSFLATSVKFVWGVVTGVAISVAIMYMTPGITSNDVINAYERGQKEALNAERPSEKLEAVCAALWLKGKQ